MSMRWPKVMWRGEFKFARRSTDSTNKRIFDGDNDSNDF